MADTGILGFTSYGPPLALTTSGQEVYVVLRDATTQGLYTGVLAPTILLSKDGGVFAAPSDGTWTELGYGVYTVTLDDLDTSTVGPYLLYVVSSGVTAAALVAFEVAISASERRTQYVRGRTASRGR